MKNLFEKNAATFLRDEGIERAGRHADRLRARWRELAYQGLLAFLKQRPTSLSFTCEDVRGACGDLPEPPDRRAWGAVFARAAKAELIHKVGYREHADRSRHRGISTVWEPKRAVGA